ncbi:MAG: hypothetical protein AAFP20_22500 [Cyanobacteria bacterium J06614_10]
MAHDKPVTSLYARCVGKDESGMLNPDLLIEAGPVTDITQEPCTLSGGTETPCHRITVTSETYEHAAY